MIKENSQDADSGTCPCGSDANYDSCCGVLHVGGDAPTAVALMRSRYSAFVRQNGDYLLHSWHPDSRPPAIDFDPRQRWLGLKIKQVTGGERDDLTGEVTFAARYKLDGRGFRLEECSQFERFAGRWVYRSGEIIEK